MQLSLAYHVLLDFLFYELCAMVLYLFIFCVMSSLYFLLFQVRMALCNSLPTGKIALPTTYLHKATLNNHIIEVDETKHLFTFSVSDSMWLKFAIHLDGNLWDCHRLKKMEKWEEFMKLEEEDKPDSMPADSSRRFILWLIKWSRVEMAQGRAGRNEEKCKSERRWDKDGGAAKQLLIGYFFSLLVSVIFNQSLEIILCPPLQNLCHSVGVYTDSLHPLFPSHCLWL